MSHYRNPALKQLTDQQMRYAPREQRLAQIDRAERLLKDLDPVDEYSYGELCRRVTTYRGEMYPNLLIQGGDALHDLRLFIEDLSDSIDIPADSASEPVLTVDDVSRRYNVSTKTVDRWRNRGLVSRRFRFGNRKRIGFLKSSVEDFVRSHPDDIQRGSHFTQMNDNEKEDIITRARRLARAGGCPAEISRRLAKRFGRSPETIRYTLKNHDREHPEAQVFPHALRPLVDDERSQLFEQFKRGVPVERLAAKCGRTRASVYRIVNEVRAKRLADQHIDWMHSPDFEKPHAEDLILGPAPEADKKSGRLKPPPGLPPYLASLYNLPLLTKDEEVYYFRKMNYLKWQAGTLRESIDLSRPRTKDMDQIERLMAQSVEVKNLLIRSNLRLVVSIAKRHIRPGGNFFEMVSDGNMSLIRAIEKFDYMKGNKFSTYASWAIMKNFARSIPAEHNLLDRYRTGNEELFTSSQDVRSDQFEQELVNHRQHQLLLSILDQLDGREKDILVSRYGLEQGTEPQTLEQVGQRFGVTKERIRQLEARALGKLRKIAEGEKLDIPGI